MQYEQASKIERRFEEALKLIHSRRLDSRSLAEALGISTATVQRTILALRQRGYSIRAVHDERGWGYELQQNPAEILGPGANE